MAFLSVKPRPPVAPGRGRARLKAGVAALALAVGVSSLPGVPVASAASVSRVTKRAAAPERVTERPDRVSAALAARLQGSRVLISGETTESSQTYANGDGTFTVETVSGVARVQKDGRWTPVDPRLSDAGNGVLKARAVKPELEFSAGGRTPFAKMTREPGRSLALSWPSELPKPVIKDNTATYAGVAGPGGDLVVTALPTGMRFDIVLRERPRGNVEFKVPLRTEGLTAGTTADGRLELTGGKKKLVAAAAAPAMWEAGTSGKVAATHGRRGDRGRLGNSPIDLTGATTATWGQSVDLPRVGAAVFPAWRVPARAGSGAYQPATADWEYGRLTYIDVNGRPVNTASYGAGAWQISATRYDDNGNTVWDLTPGNRLQALTPAADTDPYVRGLTSPTARADLLATISTYNTDGDLLAREGPAHQVKLASGSVVSARQRTSSVYDEGKPDPNVNYHLVTTTTVQPRVIDGTVTPGPADTRTTKTGYNAIVSGDTTGWDLFKSTSLTTVMPGGTDIVKRTRYDAAGREIERHMPASNGSDAGTTITAYYTAGTHPSVAACGNKPQWATLTCRTAPAAQPGGQTIPATTITYGYYGQEAVKTETSGSATRTTTVTFDTAGRPATRAVAASPTSATGTPVPAVTFAYHASTGLPNTVSAGGATVTRSYDALGRVSSITDADGNSSVSTYDTYGRLASLNDGKGSYTYTYDGTDASGQAERRGMITSVNTGTPGTVGAAFDANGQPRVQSHPGGLTAMWRYDNAGKSVALTYAKAGSTWLEFTATPDNDGHTVLQTGSGGSRQMYAYDAAARLSNATDSYAGTCVTRQYGFSLNSNRTSLTTYPAAGGGACSTATTPVTQAYTYDAADRLTTTGYTYDEFGRTSTVPAGHVSGGVDLNVGYHADDMVASLTQGLHTREFTLDPLGRVRAMTSSGGLVSGTMTNHYATTGDSPVWIAEADGTWTRNVVGIAGLAATQSSDGIITLQLSNLHGDIVATADNSPSATGISSYFEQTEYGSPRADNITNPSRYAWLGKYERSFAGLAGIGLMGVRIYNPSTGRFLQTDPVAGGSATSYDYANQNPIEVFDLTGEAAKKRCNWTGWIGASASSGGSTFAEAYARVYRCYNGKTVSNWDGDWSARCVGWFSVNILGCVRNQPVYEKIRGYYRAGRNNGGVHYRVQFDFSFRAGSLAGFWDGVWQPVVNIWAHNNGNVDYRVYS
ncbi:RHS repeat-associated core domain-containing protein [Sphaerisporangium sp. NPDC051017]|uniref:RHS repeat domain-containing protein n=1 Tax=Sphaerisporangium sp. NPDC051017 TaxID=3154636 RepID=UPI0034342D74